MDPLITSLINAGGFGILSAVLFWLHRESLKTFREELKEERENCQKNHDRHFNEIVNVKSTLLELRAQLLGRSENDKFK